MMVQKIELLLYDLTSWAELVRLQSFTITSMLVCSKESLWRKLYLEEDFFGCSTTSRHAPESGDMKDVGR